MNAARKLTLTSVIRTVNLVLQVIVGMWLMPFIIHTLGDRIYGYWVFIAAFLGYYGLLDLGIVTAVRYSVARAIGEKDQDEIYRAVSSSFIIFGIIGALIFLATLLIAFCSPLFIKDLTEAILFRKVLLIMGVGFAVGFPCRAFLGALAADIRLYLTAGVAIISVIVRALLIVVFLKAGYGIVAMALITMLVDLVQNATRYFFVRWLWPSFHLSIKYLSRTMITQLLHYSVFTFIAKIADQIRFNAAPFIVGPFLGIERVTHYAIATRLTDYFRNVIVSFIGNIDPLFSQQIGRRDETAIRRTFILSVKIACLLALFIGFSFFVYGKQFILLWMGKDYLDAVTPFIILTMGTMLDCATSACASLLYGTARHKFFAWCNMAEALIYVVLGLLLVKSYHFVGVALGWVIPMIVIKVFIQPHYVCGYLKLRYTDFLFRIFGWSVVKIGIVFFLVWFLVSSHLIGEGLLGLFPSAAVTSIVALPLSFFWVLNPEEKKWVFNRVGIENLWKKKKR